MLTLSTYTITEKSRVIVLKGKLDQSAAKAISPQLKVVVQQNPRGNFLFDLTDLYLLTTEGAHTLIAVHDSIALGGGRAAIAKPTEEVYTELYLNGVDLFMPIYESFTQALAENQAHYGKTLLIHHPKSLSDLMPI